MDKIVLVHGFYSTSRIFRFMQNKLERNGMKCFAPTLHPIDGKYGLDDLGRKLKEEINNNYDSNEKIQLVGFSMGGIVCRYYLEELNGKDRVKQMITISTPHHGSYLSYLYPGRGIKQLRPKSEFLNNLELKEYSLLGIKLYSFMTPFDLMILPSRSSYWSMAENRKYNSFIHSHMLFNSKVIEDSLKILKKGS